MADARPATELVITAAESVVNLASDGGEPATWQVDGRKHQEPLLEGGVIETEAEWSYDVLRLTRNIPEGLSVKREFKVSKDGATLEIKVTLQRGRKVEKKLVYRRA